jgi:hypothetical protein
MRDNERTQTKSQSTKVEKKSEVSAEDIRKIESRYGEVLLVGSFKHY